MAEGIELRLTGVDGVLDMLRQLPPELVSKRGGPVKSALRKGAVVILKQAQANLQVVTSNETAEDKKRTTGLLAKNLIVSRGKAPNNGNGERYLVRVRRKVYPTKQGSSHGGLAVTTLKAAQLLEYGSSQQPAEPWIRPAFAARAPESIRVIETELLRGLDRIVKRLAKAPR